MTRFALRLFGALAFVFIATASWASCPYGTIYADGCSQAPAANADTTQQPSFFSSYAPQNGQTYASTGACVERELRSSRTEGSDWTQWDLSR